MGKRVSGLLCSLLVLFAIASPALAASPPQQPKLLSTGPSMYPRLIRLEHAPGHSGNIVASVTGAGVFDIYRSADDGKNFAKVGSIKDPIAKQGACCGAIYELPVKVGALPAGTVLWVGSLAGNPGPDRKVRIRVWQSQDAGSTWSYLSDCAAGDGNAGVWEPEISVDARNRLQCYFSDESQVKQHSQVVAATSSTDGIHWTGKRTLIAVPSQQQRPGMSVVRRLSDGRFYMSYELCNFPIVTLYPACFSYYRISKDGYSWGDPSNAGEPIIQPNGDHYSHAPTSTVVTRPGKPDLVVTVGQIYADFLGFPTAGNGGTLLSATLDAAAQKTSGWSNFAAPIQVPSARNDPCPNYTSALLPVRNGTQVLEMASDYTKPGLCQMKFGTVPIR